LNIVVTGGAGFIGSTLVDQLLKDGHAVTVLDNLSTGRRQNLDKCEGQHGFRLCEVDVALEQDLQKYFEGVEWVFHLAALADIVPSIQRPLDYHRSNVDGTVNVLEASRRAGAKRFIYAASSSCYGIAGIYPTPESAPAQPQYPYALTKYLGEQYVMHWGKVYKLPVVSLRFFNVYGPRSRASGTYGAVFGVFLAQKLHRLPFTVVGDGTQTRDFIFVTDAVGACIMAASSNLHDEILNVGSGQTYSVNTLVELLGGDAVYVPKRPGEPDRTHADTAKIRKLLGWEPRVSFEEGVKILLRDIDCWREAPVWTPDKIMDATQEWFHYLGT